MDQQARPVAQSLEVFRGRAPLAGSLFSGGDAQWLATPISTMPRSANCFRWWNGIDPPLVDFEEEFLDEVAFGLSKHRPEGVVALKRCLGSDDLVRRAPRSNPWLTPM